MDYLLDTYIFPWLPFGVSEEWRHTLQHTGMDLVRVADWTCKTQDLHKLVTNHGTFLAWEMVALFAGLMTFIHALRHGGRYLYDWIAIWALGLCVELLPQFLLSHFAYAARYHTQGVLQFFGWRTPISALFGLYPLSLYPAYIFAKRIRLPWWAEGPAAGLGALLIAGPYELVGSKLLWFTWHSSHPVFAERSGSDLAAVVPWNAFLFWMALGCSVGCALCATRKAFLTELYDWKKFVREFLCAVYAAPIALCLLGVQFWLWFHVAHNFYGIPAQLTISVCFVLFLLAVWNGSMKSAARDPSSNRYWFDELSLAVCVHFMFLMGLAIVAQPEHIVSEGIHQPIGSCAETISLKSSIGIGRTYNYSANLCENNTSPTDSVFDWHCLPGGKMPNPVEMGEGEVLDWYAICGTPIGNRASFLFLIWATCLLAAGYLYQFAACYGPTPAIPSVSYVKASKNGSRMMSSNRQKGAEIPSKKQD